MEIVEQIEKIVKYSDLTHLNNFIIMLLIVIASINFYISYKLLQDILEDNIYDYTVLVLPILATIIATTLAVICRFYPITIDKILNAKVIEYKNNVDKDKYNFIIYTNENGKYLKFDNKGNNNIQLRKDNEKIDNDIFKIIGEDDEKYLIEYEVVKRFNYHSAVTKNIRTTLPK